ncbi:hypothetical protein [Aurantimonas sp. VKM B-3413]|uniref:hypothetical protein n=1 Tax=Aurantimonas sp. VKM B-3413 TaxID=2779401 RepID=UPI001E60527E|nr:hypothetical protein [Aurantimonas sp. VKM B-3413]MCB8839495.1 hypothetical protein [Aurantimonas sp. VKM B-3413]
MAMGGQIVVGTIDTAPKQRNAADEKAAIEAGEVPDGWKNKPTKLRQKDRDARWTVEFSKAKPATDGKPREVDIVVPAFGYKNDAVIGRQHGFLRGFTVTNVAANDGAQIVHVLDHSTTGPGLSGYGLTIGQARAMAGEKRRTATSLTSSA